MMKPLPILILSLSTIAGLAGNANAQVLVGPEAFNDLSAWSFDDNGTGFFVGSTFNIQSPPVNADYFGADNSYLNVGATKDSALALYQTFTSSEVVTLSTKLYMEGTTTPGDVTTMVMGIGNASLAGGADQALHLRFYTQTDSVRVANSDNTAFFTFNYDTVYNLQIVLNNSASTVNYGDTSAVASLTADIYLDGTLMADDVNIAHGAYTGGVAGVGEFEFRTFSSVSHSKAVINYDDFSIYQGAIAVPEPGAYALLAGIFGLGFVMLRRRQS
ncbi:PEP-CTERM sorting domain-containing protein [Coraliomargarita parva]|uniref:PEP-CTERM sorting domain-containing protein n=1 Tax=Coraliomargarita parva TaxID=3014050 RepID=UPI0022B560F7|nr:PEP-CTERM sorting domain-containing protein [Coraliomargarita parva]